MTTESREKIAEGERIVERKDHYHITNIYREALMFFLEYLLIVCIKTESKNEHQNEMSYSNIHDIVQEVSY